MITDQIERTGRVTAAPAVAEMSLFVLVEALFRHLKLFLVVAGAVFALSLCWIFATPRKYESDVSILVQNARSNVLISAGNKDAPTEMREVTEEQLNSEVEVLTSNDILDEVVAAGLEQQTAQLLFQGRVAGARKGCGKPGPPPGGKRARKSNVLDATITAPTPEKAQEEMRRLVAAFIARQRQISRPARRSPVLRRTGGALQERTGPGTEGPGGVSKPAESGECQ